MGVLESAGGWAARLALVAVAALSAYGIRTYAIEAYGPVIHEFDPWFNFRATQYLADHGFHDFFHWFDYMSWYPLGRPVGTTIYPGMQITAVAIWRALGDMGVDMSLNDVCAYIPVWFGVVATLLLGLLTWECTGNSTAGAVASAIFAIIPAHIMRSVGGGYDNESVAMTAMLLTFLTWTRSLRSDRSWWVGSLAGLAYFNMVAAWGGYVFVLNMIAAHAAGLVLLGRFSNKLHRSYTLFYVIGTALAIQIPVVGMTPLKSLEQLGALGVFALLQLMAIVEYLRVSRRLSPEQVAATRLRVFGIAAAACVVVVAVLGKGYFGPLSARIRGLFVQHTRTGNPLVDSVAEHQPASPDAYWQYLHAVCFLFPIGFIAACFRRNDQKLFLVFYAAVAYYFANRMSRLIILIGPIASALGGYAVALAAEWALVQLVGGSDPVAEAEAAPAAAAAAAADAPKAKKAAAGGAAAAAATPGKTSAKKRRGQYEHLGLADDSFAVLNFKEFIDFYFSEQGRLARRVLAVAFFVISVAVARAYNDYAHNMAHSMSEPSIMFRARLQNGQEIVVDDYREAYWWLRDNTPADARVMAWWDYGYQIAGVANRTTIADGNTWNHEHIATLGRALTSPEKDAHAIVRHLADYVLIWTGGGGDDLAKSPHMARIGNSVYPDICPGDPTCRKFGFTDAAMTPSPMMAASLLYRLHSGGQKTGVEVDPKLFREAFTSKYNKVRIWQVMNVSKASKAWVADAANRVCDAPGSWYCPGQYPPALAKLMSKRKNFKQVEDFNTDVSEEDKAYNEEYMRRMAGH